MSAYTSLGFKADLYLGAWTDMSHYVRDTATVSITRGRPDESSQISPSRCTMTLDNRDGRFTTRNPAGAWYGTIGQNSPVRISLPNSLGGGATYLRIEDDSTSYASCPDAAGLDITGSIDMRLDLALTSYTPSVLAAKYDIGGFRSWALVLNGDGTVTFWWTPDGSVGAFVHATSTVPMPLGRTVLQMTMNKAGSSVVTFFTGAPGNADTGPFTQFGAQVAIPATAIFNSAARVTIGQAAGFAADISAGYAGLQGQVLEFEIRNAVGGTVVAHPVFTAQTAGATSFTDAQSNTWTFTGTAELSNRLYRFHGELSSLPKAADPSLHDVTSGATATGILSRLQLQQSPVNSAFYRANVRQTGTAAPVAYWPCEDAAGSASFASATGGTPMTFTPATQLASNSDFACSAPIPVLNGGQWAGVVPQSASTTWTSNVIRFIGEVPAAGDTNSGVLCRVYTTGTIRRLDLYYGTGGTLAMAGFDINGTQLVNTSIEAFAVNGELLLFDMELNASGGNVGLTIATVQPNAASGLAAGPFTLTTATIGAVTDVQTNPGGLLTGTAIGHVSVQSMTTSIFALGMPLGAWLGETAGNRYARLCTEEGIRSRIYGFPNVSEAMGVQTLQTVPQLLQECETTDMGMQFEPRQCLGLGYITLAALCSQPVAATASWPASSVAAGFASTGDTLLALNDVTVTNTDGSSARQILATGPMSVLSPPSGIGRIDTSITVNDENDSRLENLASWYLHVRSVSDDRYPQIPFSMVRAETPVAVANLDIGGYLQLTGTPAWMPPGPVKQLAAGFTETLGPSPIWTIGVNGIPEMPYETGIVADTVYGRADTDGSTLHASISSSALSVQADTTAGFPLWTTSAGDFPFDIKVNYGEVMTVTNITGTSSPQTFTVTRGTNGVQVAHSALEDIRLAHPMIVALT